MDHSCRALAAIADEASQFDTAHGGAKWPARYAAEWRLLLASLEASRNAAESAFDRSDEAVYASASAAIQGFYENRAPLFEQLCSAALRIPVVKKRGIAGVEISAAIRAHAAYVYRCAAEWPTIAHSSRIPALDAALRSCYQCLACGAPERSLLSLGAQSPTGLLTMLCHDAGCTPLAAFYACVAAIQGAGEGTYAACVQQAKGQYDAWSNDARVTALLGLSVDRLAAGAHLITDPHGVANTAVAGARRAGRGHGGREAAMFLAPPTSSAGVSHLSGVNSQAAATFCAPSHRRGRGRGAWHSHNVHTDMIAGSIEAGKGREAAKPAVSVTTVLALPYALSHGPSPTTVCPHRALVTVTLYRVLALLGMVGMVGKGEEREQGRAQEKEGLLLLSHVCRDVRRLLQCPEALEPSPPPDTSAPAPLSLPTSSSSQASRTSHMSYTSSTGKGQGREHATPGLSVLWIARLMAMLACAASHGQASGPTPHSRLALCALVRLTFTVAQHAWATMQGWERGGKTKEGDVHRELVPLWISLTYLSRFHLCEAQQWSHPVPCAAPPPRHVAQGKRGRAGRKRAREEEERGMDHGEGTDGDDSDTGAVEASIRWAGQHLFSCIRHILDYTQGEEGGGQAKGEGQGGQGAGAGDGRGRPLANPGAGVYLLEECALAGMGHVLGEPWSSPSPSMMDGSSVWRVPFPCPSNVLQACVINTIAAMHGWQHMEELEVACACVETGYAGPAAGTGPGTDAWGESLPQSQGQAVRREAGRVRMGRLQAAWGHIVAGPGSKDGAAEG